MSDHILNPPAGYWLPPDFLSDEDDRRDILINTANTTLFLNSRVPVYYRPVPPHMETTHGPPAASQSPTWSVSPQSRLAGFGSLKSSNGSSNANLRAPSPLTSPLVKNGSRNFKYGLPPPPPPPPPSAANLLLPGLRGPDYKGLLYHHSSPTPTPTWRRPMTEVYCSPQKIMVHNRAGERVVGYGGAMTGTGGGWCGRNSAWPPLPQQLPNPLLWRGCSGSGVKRECAGTGVFLPRRYGKLPDSSPKKPDGMGRKKLQQLMHHHHKKIPSLQGEEDVPLTHELRLPHEWTY